MKRLVFLVVFVALALAGYVLYKGKTPPERASKIHYRNRLEIYYGGRLERRVTIKSPTGVMSVINLPVGVMLSVEHDRAASDKPVRGTHTFRGDVIVRTRRYDELDTHERFGTPEERNAEVIMARSPFVLTLRDVDVTVETLN